MRVLVIGASGTIGREVSAAFRAGGHEVVEASFRRSEHEVDISNPDSIRALYDTVGRVDAVVCAAGSARFSPLRSLTDEDFDFSLANKLMGQVNLVRLGVDALYDGGSFTVTSGVLSHYPIPGSAAISLVNSGLEGFTRAAAIELPRGLRINCVSPGWVAETLAAMGQDPAHGTPAARVAELYLQSALGDGTGQTIGQTIRPTAG